MRVLIVPDQLQFEQPGGLRVQVCETAAALGRLRGVEVAVAGTLAGALPPCDIVHLVGSAGAGDWSRAASEACVPLVFSPRLSTGWNRANGSRARVADRVQGNRTDCDLDTGYAQVRRALQAAALVVAHCEAERKSVCDAFLQDPARVRVVPHGVARRFFDADPGPFRAHARIAGRFALMVGQVSARANQAGVARALAELALPLVVIGATRERDAGYLGALRELRTVTCLGPLDHASPLLASAYAAASVLVQAGPPDRWPMAVAEALAAGTPAVTSAAAALPLAGDAGALRHAGWQDDGALKAAVSDLLERPPAPAATRALVRPFSWQEAARRLAACYRELLDAA